VTTKYNPARTWTPENAVGIGGAYLCVYGMEGPGGYQFVGRTVQMWNTWKSTPAFEPGTPWLLRFFDQVHFYPVSAEELLEAREEFPRGRFPLNIENGTFGLADYQKFLKSIGSETAAFNRQREAAFDEERERWATAGKNEFVAETNATLVEPTEEAAPEGCSPVHSPIAASVWSVAVSPGQRVEAGQKLMVLEAMKMEILVAAPRAGLVVNILSKPGAVVSAGQNLLWMRLEEAA
jgi:urea carboxylase